MLLHVIQQLYYYTTYECMFHIVAGACTPGGASSPARAPRPLFGRGDDQVGNPLRARSFQFELFELMILLNLDTVLYRAIRADSISISGVLPSSWLCSCILASVLSGRSRVARLKLSVQGSTLPGGRFSP